MSWIMLKVKIIRKPYEHFLCYFLLFVILLQMYKKNGPSP